MHKLVESLEAQLAIKDKNWEKPMVASARVAQKRARLEVIRPSGSGLSVLLLCAPMGLKIEYTNTL
jgi:hypothetical protein